MSTRALSYRHDIDGLRAISMLVILIVHLDLPVLPGGFVAVDLFFVISGYVITRIIFKSMTEGRFSLRDFYERRTRRLLPAMAVMLLTTLLACVVLLPPSVFLEFSTSVIATIFFAANFFFWHASDYFAVAAEFKPLLHCWTLAVEEQLYLVFPLLLMLLARRSRAFAINGTLMAFALSFACCVYLTYTSKLAAFYLMPSRAWEFLAGAIVALDVLPRLQRQWLRESFTVTGMVLIATAMLVIREQDAFPGFYALWPVAGCAFIIYGGNDGACRSAAPLRWKPLVYIGCISYSLYLWHWPLIALANNIVEGELPLAMKATLAAAAIALGSLSYHFIEQPFRTNAKAMSMLTLRRGMLAASTVAACGLLAYVATINGKYGAYLELAEKEQNYRGYRAPCDLSKSTPQDVESCTFGDVSASKTFLMWGDSHAFTLFPAFDVAATQAGWRGIWTNRAGCPPLFDVYRLDGKSLGFDGRPQDTYCASTGGQVRRYLREHPVDLVFLVSRWSIWDRGYIKQGRLQEATHFLSDASTQSYDAANSAIVFERALHNTVKEIANDMKIPVVAIGPVPVLPRLVSEIDPATVALTRAEYDAQKAFSARVFDDLVREVAGFRWIDVTDDYCTALVCLAYDNGKPLYGDDNHTSHLGALKIMSDVKTVLSQTAR